MAFTYVLLGVSLILVALYLSFNSLSSLKQKWIKKSQLDVMEDRYDVLRESYRELKVY